MIITPISKIKIFISYHREDTAASSGRLYNYLSDEFGRKNVFKDIFSMEGGDPIRTKIEDAIKSSDVFLAVIGKRWSEIQKRSHENENKEDWVGYEILSAFQMEKIIIPVLVDNALVPDSQILSDQLKPLIEINACELTFKHYEYDVKELIKDIRLKVKEKRKKALGVFNWVTRIVIITSIVLGIYFLNQEISHLKIGQDYQGGIIFYIDSTNKHGLVCSPLDINRSLNWYDAMEACKAYRGGGLAGWRLPSKEELSDMYSKRDVIKNFSVDCNASNFGNCSYWSSSEMSDTTMAWNLYFTNGLFWSNYDKNGPARVRAVKNF